MICNNYDTIKAKVGDAKLLVVSKTQTNEKILQLYKHGVRCFGENRINDLKYKVISLPEDIEWHFIGRIQSKKIRDIVKCSHLIHSVDSIKTLELIDKEANKIKKEQHVLIQINVSGEDSKTGFLASQLNDVLKVASKLSNVKVDGIMTMAPFTDDTELLNSVFEKMQKIYQMHDFTILSMGMSNDYEIALQYGANLVRIGSSIFKEE